MKNRWLVCLAFAAGILLGFLISKPSITHAQGAVVKVTRVYPGQSAQVTGTVVGFSCINEVGTFNGASANPDCFVATQ